MNPSNPSASGLRPDISIFPPLPGFPLVSLIIRFACRAGACLIVKVVAGLLLPAVVWAQPAPIYDLQAKLDTTQHRIAGSVRVRLGEEDQRPRDAWWFRLPPNRFKEEDPRGIARRIAPLPMGFMLSRPDPVDPLFPEGFDSGDIWILAVQDEAGRPLSYTLEDDPGLPTGMWRGDALMRVAFDPASSGREVMIRFVTRLPNRHTDGWNEQGIVAEQWHPLLLAHRGGKWIRDGFAPAGGRYRIQMEVDQGGWLKAGPAAARHMPEPGSLAVPLTAEAQRVFPIVFLRRPERLEASTPTGNFQVFFREGNERAANHTLAVAERFSAFMLHRYGLSLPEPAVSFVQSDLGTGEPFTVGGTIIIPTKYFKNDSLLDRVYEGKLARAMAELWFGESVWSNRNNQAWLHLGLTGYFALEYFELIYGWDASIHDLLDWLSPKYREHFYEQMTMAEIRAESDVPLTTPIHDYPIRQPAMVAAYQKTPLVVRALAYTMGPERFAAGLRRFYGDYRRREASAASFRESLEAAGGQPLDWYFDAWFHGTTRMDYALGDWETAPQGDGYKLTVELLRLEPGVMPVDLRVNMVDGTHLTRRWDGRAEKTVMEIALPSPVESLMLDPREYLLETERQNNLSDTEIRWRPFYDWSKQRETLVTIVTRLGGNAIDGNIIGIGTSIKLDHSNTLSLIPIFAENTDEVLFEASYSRNHFLVPPLSLQLVASKVGGKRTLSSGIRYAYADPGNIDQKTTYTISLEEVEATSLGTSDDDPIQEAGNTNNISILHTGLYNNGEPYASDLLLELEHSQPALDSDFRYTTFFANFGQQLDFHVNHAFRIELIRGLTDGFAPLQKQHLLGDPLVLRGFPRTISLVHENIAALRLEYQYVMSRHIYGDSVQSRKLTLLLFSDVGKGWANDEDFDEAVTRRDVGIGINFDLSLLNTLNFPIRVELAFPIDDPEFKDRQVIFFQALSFF